MPICASCGHESVDAFRFCPECGAPAVPAAGGQRKTVTVLFSDLVGSTALGERTDPELLRELMGSYHAEARMILRTADRQGEAREAAEEAVALFERKGNVVGAARANALLVELAD